MTAWLADSAPGAEFRPAAPTAGDPGSTRTPAPRPQEAGDDAEKATRLLINRLLHDPSINLRQAASGAPGELNALDRALRKLFQLQDMPSDNAVGDKDEEP